MPGLTFAPDHERHLTLTALGHCFEHYRLLQEQAQGRLPASVPGKSLLIGIGMDVGVGCLWAQTQAGAVRWNVDVAVGVAREALAAEYPGLDVREAWAEIEPGIRQYAEQWGDGIRGWEILSVHPYLDRANWPRLTLKLPGGRPYLTMPDVEARVGGVVTIVDHKTSAFGYKAEDWAFEPQMLANTLAASRHYGEPCQWLIDFMQRPSRYKKNGLPTWTFPPVQAFPFTKERADAAEEWLNLGAHRLDWYDQYMCAHDGRDPAACRTWYGRCEFWERCWAPAGDDLEAKLKASLGEEA